MVEVCDLDQVDFEAELTGLTGELPLSPCGQVVGPTDDEYARHRIVSGPRQFPVLVVFSQTVGCAQQPL